MKRRFPLFALLLLAVAATLAAAGCGSSGGSGPAATAAAPEVSPAGDIPDNQAFVEYAPPGASFAVKVPEGWARTVDGKATVFTDKLNAIRIEAAPAPSAPTVETVTATTVPALRGTATGFELGSVQAVSRKAGTAIRLTYRADSSPDPVTGKTVLDDVEQYVFFHKGTAVTLTLSGPKGADNVDPWRIVTDSLRWTS